MKKTSWVAAGVIAAMLGTAGPAAAFNDLDNAEQKTHIMKLKERGVINGLNAEQFAPRNKMTSAQAVSLLVKAFELSLAHFTFIKAPEATDYYTTIPNDAWYAEAYVIAQLNGLSIPRDVNPNAEITREQFAQWLIEALDTTGSYPVIKMLVILEDEEQIDPAFSYNIQRLILHGFFKPEDHKFYPKQPLTRGEAAVWVNKAAQFVKEYKDQVTQEPVEVYEVVEVSIEKVTDEVNKVILTREEQPTGGYGIEVTGIRFTEDGKAVITYALINPHPDSMNIQVITQPQTETYVSSKYEVVAELDPIIGIPMLPPAKVELKQ